MEEILEKYPGRDEYVKQLFQLFGHRSHSFPSSLYISGCSGTGKTGALRNTLNYLGISYAFIDCIENYTSKMFFEAIINGLNDHKLTPNNNYDNYAICDSIEDFLETLNAMDSAKSHVIVLKNFVRLNEIESNILPVMMRFKQLIPALNISCILIGSQTHLNYIGKEGFIPTNHIHCEQYSKDDLKQILSKQIQNLRKIMMEIVNEGDSDEQLRNQRLQILTELDEPFFIGFFNSFLDTFHPVCRNAKELIYLCNANFPIYCKPVIDGDIRAHELRKLFKNMELPFKLAMNSIYCRIDQPNVSIFLYFVCQKKGVDC